MTSEQAFVHNLGELAACGAGGRAVAERTGAARRAGRYRPTRPSTPSSRPPFQVLNYPSFFELPAGLPQQYPKVA